MASQLIGMIKRRDMSPAKLQELPQMANAQLERYEKAKTLQCVSHWQWDNMLRDHQLQLRTDYIAIVEEGQHAFTEVKQVLVSQIDGKK